MLMEIHLAFMGLPPTANYQTIPTLSVLRRKHSCGWRNTAMILYVKDISSTCNGMGHLYIERQLRRPLLKRDIKIKTVLFTCSRLLPNYMLCGQTTCFVNDCMKCCCSSVIP